MKSDPSINSSDLGRASGFSLPLFRGQDARASHVFLEDIELQDPYSGLPMIDEIDLRAFGSVAVHKGFSPWDISVVEPGGVIQFTKRKSAEFVLQLDGGLSRGNIIGTSGWARTSHAFEEVDFSLYARRSTSKGDHKVYSDNGTVLNSSDDSLKKRSNNDRDSNQVLGQFDWLNNTAGINGFAWVQQSHQGIAAADVSENGTARLKGKTGVGSSTLKYFLNDDLKAGLNVGFFKAQRIFSDPGNAIGFASKRTLESQSSRVKAFLRNDSDFFSWLASMEKSTATSKLNSTYSKDIYSPHAEILKGFFGSKLNLYSSQIIELKVSSEQSNSTTKNGVDEDQVSTKFIPTLNRSLAWSTFAKPIMLYFQVGATTRAPSLLERLGNGSDIEGAKGLRPENTNAAEIGAKFSSPWIESTTVSAGVTIWGRSNTDVIRIEKISASRWRALNSKRQIYRGIEVRGDIGNSQKGIEMAVSGINAKENSLQFIIPRVPLWQAAGGVRYNFMERLTLRTQTRFTGRMYDDHSNTRELDWKLIHDLSLDYMESKNPWKLGFAVNNVSDYTSTKVIDTVTHQEDGRMAYAGYSGEPLAGRSYIASVSASL